MRLNFSSFDRIIAETTVWSVSPPNRLSAFPKRYPGPGSPEDKLDLENDARPRGTCRIDLHSISVGCQWWLKRMPVKS